MIAPKTPTETFILYVEQKGNRPSSLKELCVWGDLDIEHVKKGFNNVVNIEKEVWKQWFNETIDVLKESKEYEAYSARERLLAFYYTWLETIAPYRSYIIKAPTIPRLFSLFDQFLASINEIFLDYAGNLIAQAIENNEIVDRYLVTNFYDKALWQQFLFVMNFWINDKSVDQAKTDEAIERAVQLSLHLAVPTQIDSLIDFGKFLLKNR